MACGNSYLDISDANRSIKMKSISSLFICVFLTLVALESMAASHGECELALGQVNSEWREAELSKKNAQYLRRHGRPEEKNLAGKYLVGADLSSADLPGVDLTEANLTRANLTGANLS